MSDNKQSHRHASNFLTLENLETSEGDALKCQWNLCKFATEDRQELLRHLDYHAYHTRLKTFGWGLADTITIPNCHNDSKFRNDIPPIPNDYFCYWGRCSFSSSTYTEYLEHVNNHLKLDYKKNLWAENVKLDCRWDGCNRQIPYMQLKRHLKTHTKEKMIGCANCGALFINKPLFINHCIRQAVNREFTWSLSYFAYNLQMPSSYREKLPMCRVHQGFSNQEAPERPHSYSRSQISMQFLWHELAEEINPRQSHP